MLCSADLLAEVDGADEVAAVSLHPLGASVPGLPPGVRDHTSEVRVHGDHFTPVPVPGSASATPTRTVDALVDAARARATALGLTADDRVLRITPEEVEDVLFSPPLDARRDERDGTYLVFGRSRDGRRLLVVIAPRPDNSWYVVTARDVDKAERRRMKR